MATVTIRVTGSTTPANTPGISKFYIAGETLTLDDPANAGAATHAWLLIDAPPGQSSPLVNPATATPTLVLDAAVAGTYRFQYTADGVDVGQLLIAVAIDGERIPGYLEEDDIRATAPEATWNLGGNTKGWFEAQHSLTKKLLGGGGGGVTNPLILESGSIDTVSAVGADSGVLIAGGPSGGSPGTDSMLLSADGLLSGYVNAEYGAGTALMQADSQGGFATGQVSARYGTAEIKTDGAGGASAGGYSRDIGTGLSSIFAYGRGAQAFGFAKTGYNSSATAESKIYAQGSGSFARGSVDGGYSADGTAVIAATEDGAFAGGHAIAPGNAANPDSRIGAYSRGAFAHGAAYYSGQIEAYGTGAWAGGVTNGNPAVVRAYGGGAFAFGSARYGSIRANNYGSVALGNVFYGNILASGYGSFAAGNTYGEGGGIYGTITASGYGAVALGYGYYGSLLASGKGSLAAGFSYGDINATGVGSVALGSAQGGSGILSTNDGSFAGGFALGGYDVAAGGDGAFAFGKADSADVSATATNSAQFGPGTNAVADSLKVGTAGMRLRGTTSFATPANGDLGVDGSGNIQMQTGGITTKVAGLDVIQAFSKQQHPTPQALTDAANIAIVATDRNAYTLLATGGVGATREIDNASAVLPGMSWTIAFTNDTGGRDITFGTNYSWGDETPPVFTAQAAGEITLLTLYALSSTKVVITALTGH